MKKISKHIRKSVAQILERADIHSVVAGFSGGADSVTMVHILRSLGVDLRAVHCNFRLRGEESDRDENFCRQFCREYDIPLEVVAFDTKEYCRLHGVSVEKGCRDLRYSFFNKVMNAERLDRIAVAHNSDDQAETVLLNLFRGAGVKGLAGMLPDSGTIFRPLLSFSRATILDYIKEERLQYITDSSNLSSDYRRNFIRNEVIPLIETRWPGVKKRLCSTSSIMQTQYAFNTEMGKEFDTDRLLFSTLSGKKSQVWAIHSFAESAGANPSQADEMARFYLSSDKDVLSGRQWFTDAGKRIIAERDGFYLANPTELSTSDSGISEIIREEYEYSEALMKRIKCAPLSELWLPANIKPIFRKWKIGDRIAPLGMKGSQLISDIIKDAKLSTIEKEGCIVAIDADSKDILWVKGLKRSRHHLITPNIKRVIRYI